MNNDENLSLTRAARIQDRAPGHMANEVTAAINATAHWPTPEQTALLQQGKRLPLPGQWDGRTDSSDSTEVRYG